MMNTQSPYFISINRLALAIIFCSGVLTGFQFSEDAHSAIQKPLVLQPEQLINNDSPFSQQAEPAPISAISPDQTLDQAFVVQPVTLIKPQPLPILQPVYTDLSTSLSALITKQIVKMDPYIPFIQTITIGLEQISFTKNLWYGLKKLKNQKIEQPHEWSGTISILWKGNIQLVGNLGHVSLYPAILKSNTHTYRTEGFYGSLGVGYVFHYNTTNNLYTGIHYSRAHFTNHILSKSESTKKIRKSLTASWFEAVIGAESRLFDKVALYGGCALHIGWLYNFKPFNEAKNYVIPGYGLNANKLNVGLNLYILYKFSFIERMIKVT